jgi:predicted ArsR family transcriptional regulator
MVQKTSLEAWRSLQFDLGDRQARVYQAILRLGAATNKQISDYLEIPINCVTPRVFELRQIGVVEEYQTVKQLNGRKATSWRPVQQRVFKEVQKVLA